MRITAFVAAAALTLGQIAPAYAQEPVKALQSTQTIEEGGLAQGPLDEIGDIEVAVVLTLLALLGVGLAVGLGGGNDSTSTPNTN